MPFSPAALCALGGSDSFSVERSLILAQYLLIISMIEEEVLYQRSGGNKLVTGSEEIRETIRDMVEKIVQGYQPKKIILFGSFAYGQPSEDSDIDLFIIKNTDQKPIERWTEIKRLLRDLSHSVPVAPLVYTEQELEARRAIKDFFVEEILEKGEVLYEG